MSKNLDKFDKVLVSVLLVASIAELAINVKKLVDEFTEEEEA